MGFVPRLESGPFVQRVSLYGLFASSVQVGGRIDIDSGIHMPVVITSLEQLGIVSGRVRGADIGLARGQRPVL